MRSRKEGRVLSERKEGYEVVRPKIIQRRWWAQAGPNMGPIWAPAEIGQKTTNLAQSKICAKLMNNKEKVLVRSGSYGWT